MSEIILFNKYLESIKKSYEDSDIKKSNWYYSLSSTPLYKNAVVLCGLNWGVSKDHKPQDEYPSQNFLDNKDLGSFVRIKEYINTYLPTDFHLKIVQINLCFFRSENEKQLNNKDFDLNVDIFKNLVKDLQPKIFIACSVKIIDVLKDCLGTIEQKNIANGRKIIQLKKSNFIEEYGGGSIAYIPHPNYPLKANARIQAWKYGLGK